MVQKQPIVNIIINKLGPVIAYKMFLNKTSKSEDFIKNSVNSSTYKTVAGVHLHHPYSNVVGLTKYSDSVGDLTVHLRSI